MSPILYIIMSLMFLLLTPATNAHPLAPSLLKIELTSEHDANLSWKESELKPQGTSVGPLFPPDCAKTTEPAMHRSEGALTYLWSIHCDAPLAGQTVRLHGLDASRGNVLVVYRDLQGNTISRLMGPADHAFVVPERPEAAAQFRHYVSSGIEHLLTGWDHVLFVCGLFVLLRQRIKTLLIAVTAFTVGHSITLMLASTGQLPVNSHWAEVLIALSITLLGLELLQQQGSALRWSIRRWPYVLTFLFGLIHGAGFASVLADALAKEASLTLPVFAFNLGIEVGQALLLVGLAATHYAITKFLNGYRTHMRWLLGYAMGILSVYWLFTRLAA